MCGFEGWLGCMYALHDYVYAANLLHTYRTQRLAWPAKSLAKFVQLLKYIYHQDTKNFSFRIIGEKVVADALFVYES